MQGTPQPLTAEEIKEIAQVEELQETWQTAKQLEEEIRSHWACKIENYITDGPGYAGTLYVVVWGIPMVTLLTRGRDGRLRVEEN